MRNIALSTVALAAVMALAGCSSPSAPVATAPPVHSPTTLHLAGVAPGQLIEVQTAQVLAVAPAVLIGRGGEGVTNRSVQLVTVEFTNGGIRAVVQPPQPAFAVGEPVEIIALENGDYPSVEPLPSLPHPVATAENGTGGKQAR